LQNDVLKCIINHEHNYSQDEIVFNFVIEVGDKNAIKRWKKNLKKLSIMRKQIESKSNTVLKSNSNFLDEDQDRERCSNFLLSYLNKNKVNTIIELGCGNGSMQQYFNEENYIGLDPYIAVDVEQLYFPFVRGSSEALPFMGGGGGGGGLGFWEESFG
jgi:hypothetical protein